MLKYLRKVRLTASGSGGGIVINPGPLAQHEIMIAFSVQKTISSQANAATIDIYNLAESTRNAMGKELDQIKLEAGYAGAVGSEGNVGIIFEGQIRDPKHTRSGVDIITTLTCGDGDAAFRRGTISKSFPKGTKVETVMEELYKQFEKEGVRKGEWKFPEGMKGFERPYAMCGGCKREADTIGRGKGFYWSIQNGVMEVVPGDGYIGGSTLINSQSGLIGVPTITDNGIEIDILLDPEIRPGRRITVQSQVLEMNAEGGEYRISDCTFSGDNRTGDFKVSIGAEAIKGGKVDQGIKP